LTGPPWVTTVRVPSAFAQTSVTASREPTSSSRRAGSSVTDRRLRWTASPADGTDSAPSAPAGGRDACSTFGSDSAGAAARAAGALAAAGSTSGRLGETSSATDSANANRDPRRDTTDPSIELDR